MVAFSPLFVLLMGLILGNDPRPEFGDRGYIDANLGSFAAIVVAIVGFVLVPIDIVAQRGTGALRRFRATPLRRFDGGWLLPGRKDDGAGASRPDRAHACDGS